MLCQPLRGARDGDPCRHDIAIAETLAQRRRVEHAMRRPMLLDEWARGHGDVPRHGDDLDLVIEFARDDLDHLAERQALVICRIEALSGRGGMTDGEQHCVREILDVAVGQQRQPAVGDDDMGTSIEDPAHDRPFAAAQVDAARTPSGSGSAWLADGARKRSLRCAPLDSSCRRRSRRRAAASSRVGSGSPGGLQRSGSM